MINPVKVFRIENARGVGPYMSDIIPQEYRTQLTDEVRHPEPYKDSRLVSEIESRHPYNFNLIPTWMRFGFGSIDQLRNWFYNDDWLYTLHKYGFVLVEYTVSSDRVYLGNTQCTFKASCAGNIERYSILEYFNLVNKEHNE